VYCPPTTGALVYSRTDKDLGQIISTASAWHVQRHANQYQNSAWENFPVRAKRPHRTEMGKRALIIGTG